MNRPEWMPTEKEIKDTFCSECQMADTCNGKCQAWFSAQYFLPKHWIAAQTKLLEYLIERMSHLQTNPETYTLLTELKSMLKQIQGAEK
jgi:hypothetical protein